MDATKELRRAELCRLGIRDLEAIYRDRLDWPEGQSITPGEKLVEKILQAEFGEGE